MVADTFAQTWTNAMINHRAIPLFWLWHVILYFSHLLPQSSCEKCEWGGFLMGSNNLNTDCSCHAPSVIYNQAVLSCSVTTTETLVWWVETFFFSTDTGKLELPVMTQCPQITVLKYCYSICQFGNAGWIFSWWSRQKDDITLGGSHLGALGQ